MSQEIATVIAAIIVAVIGPLLAMLLRRQGEIKDRLDSNSEKLIVIHELVNSNLSNVKSELKTANERIETLYQRIDTLSRELGKGR